MLQILYLQALWPSFQISWYTNEWICYNDGYFLGPHSEMCCDTSYLVNVTCIHWFIEGSVLLNIHPDQQKKCPLAFISSCFVVHIWIFYIEWWIHTWCGGFLIIPYHESPSLLATIHCKLNHMASVKRAMQAYWSLVSKAISLEI